MLVGNFYFQPNSTFCNGRKVALNPEEQVIAWTLAKACGKPVKVADIMATLYGNNVNGVDSDIVKVSISTMRRKMEKANDGLHPVHTGAYGTRTYSINA